MTNVTSEIIFGNANGITPKINKLTALTLKINLVVILTKEIKLKSSDKIKIFN